MDRIGVVGVSWKRGGTEALSRFTIPVEERPERLPALAARIGADELVYLATCNRVEVAFAAHGRTPVAAYRPRIFGALCGRDPDPGEAERTFQAWVGEGAAEHLFLVASGFESAKLGETEIAGQLREAFELARSLGLTDGRLDLVFEEALRVARRVHGSTALGRGRVSLAELAIEHARSRLAATPGPLAVVGVSPMTVRCAETLAAEGSNVIVANRTLARAQELAQRVRGSARSLEAFRTQPDPAEVIVLATASPEPVLRRPELERLAAGSPSGRPPLLIDMAVPPDVDPDAAAVVGLRRIGMAEIIAEADAHRSDRIQDAAEARPLVDDALVAFRARIVEWALAPALATIQKRYRETALEGAERLFRRELTGLGEKEREAVRAWAQTLARRFAHLPSAGLRGLAAQHGLRAVESFLHAGDERLVSEAEQAARARSKRRSLKLSRGSFLEEEETP